MTTNTGDDWPPEPAELAALRARTLSLLLAGIADDADRVAAEALNIVRAGHDTTLYVLGALTSRAATALVRQHSSPTAATDAVNTQLAETFEAFLADHE